jgi:hypothetical protein
MRGWLTPQKTNPSNFVSDPGVRAKSSRVNLCKSHDHNHADYAQCQWQGICAHHVVLVVWVLLLVHAVAGHEPRPLHGSCKCKKCFKKTTGLQEKSMKWTETHLRSVSSLENKIFQSAQQQWTVLWAKWWGRLATTAENFPPRVFTQHFILANVYILDAK